MIASEGTAPVTRQVPSLADADELAESAHVGQVDKAGRPMIEHVRGVAAIVRDNGGDEAAQIVALLHDLLEETDYTAEDLHAMGYPADIVADVVAVTRVPGEPYQDGLIERAATFSRRARRVKMADNTRNRTGLDLLPDQRQAASLLRRYERAYERLLEADLADPGATAPW